MLATATATSVSGQRPPSTTPTTLPDRLREDLELRLAGADPPRGEKLDIELGPGETGYNHTAVERGGEVIYFVRVDQATADGPSEYNSETRAYRMSPSGRLVRDDRFQTFIGQDPRVEHISGPDGGFWVLNYTELGPIPRWRQWLRWIKWFLYAMFGYTGPKTRLRRFVTEARFRRVLSRWAQIQVRHDGVVRWRTRFHAGRDLTNMPSIGVGRWSMKNFAFADGFGGLIGVFGRPMGKWRGGAGQINLHLVFARSPEALRRRLRPWRLWLAPIIRGYTDAHSWAGVNSATPPPKHVRAHPAPQGAMRAWIEFSLRYGALRLLWPLFGRLFRTTAFADQFGVISHIAEWTKNGVTNQRWYAGTSSVLRLQPLLFWFRPRRPALSGYRLIVTPESAMHLPPDPKRPDLRFVAFASRVVRRLLHFGACDVHACVLPVDQVFDW